MNCCATGSSWISPALAAAAGLLALLGLGLTPSSKDKGGPRARAALLTTLVAGGVALGFTPCQAASDGLLKQDGLAWLWQGLFLVSAVPLALLMPLAGEFSAALVAAALLGMLLLAAANHLVLFFLALELMSLPAYLLVYHLRRDRRSLEAALKYFFAGSVGSALFLFGASLFYSLTGTLSMEPQLATSPRLELSLALMGAGALFKLGAAPLHFWLPDVYEAAEPELVGFFSTGVKAAGLLFLLRVLTLLPPAAGGLTTWLPAISVVTMTLGNLLALRQTSLQRLLAYSSISHVGYLLMGVWAWSIERPASGPAAVYVYAASYLFMSSGAFAALRLGGLTHRRQLAGFASRRPGLAAFLALMLLSLASVPPTAGFLAKFLVFWDALQSGGFWLAAIAAANSVVGLGYYFALIRELYLGAPGESTASDPGPLTLRGKALAFACAAPTLLLGVWPGALRAAQELLQR